MKPVKFFLRIALMLLFGLPLHAATSTCSYDFTTGSGSTSYVTANGNILEITTPFGVTRNYQVSAVSVVEHPNH
jgi:hypothetical protein